MKIIKPDKATKENFHAEVIIVIFFVVISYLMLNEHFGVHPFSRLHSFQLSVLVSLNCLSLKKEENVAKNAFA